MFVDILIILGATVGIYFFSEMLSKGTDQIGTRYGINPSVRGATLDAVASSFPEFCTVIFALQVGAFDAGIGAIAGSALYNILVIPAVSVFVGGRLHIQKTVVRRDGFLYLAVVIALVLAIWLGPQRQEGDIIMHELPMWIGLIGIIIYVGYVVVLVMQARAPAKVAGGEGSPQGAPKGENEASDTEAVMWKTALVIMLGMGGIGLATHFLVESSLHLFHEWGFSAAIAGVTVLAAATSLPDTLLSVFAVRRGDADGAVSNALGSNSFDILICLGLPIFVTNGVLVNWGESWAILSFLLVSTVLSVAFLITDWTLTRREGVIMAAIYITFMVLAFARII